MSTGSLTDYALYDKVCLKLRDWILPLPWPGKSIDILHFVNRESKKILPYIVTVNNLFYGRDDLNSNYHNRPSFTWLADDQGRELTAKFVNWISKLTVKPEDPIYYCTYNIQNNRTVNIWYFTQQSLWQNFNFAKKENRLTTLRYFCYFMGSPLTSIQRREVGGKHVYVLSTPKDLIGYAT